MAIKFTKPQLDLLKKLGIQATIILIATVMCIYLNGALDNSDKKHKWLQSDISELGRKLDGLNKKTLEFSEAVKTWEGLADEDKKLQGLRINDAKDMLDKLEKKYKLSAVKTSFSKPDELSGDYKSDTVSLVSSVISITFNALSDEYVYNFISDIMDKFPGFVQIKSFSMNKPAAITKELLKKISAGEEASVISVNLDFYWHDLKYKGPATTPQPAGGAPGQ